MKRYYLPWIILAVLVIAFFGYTFAPTLSAKQFYLVITDDGANYVCTLHSNHFWQPVENAYVARDVFFVRQRDPRNAQSGIELFKHSLDIHWPWQTYIMKQHVRAVEPINKDSPLGKLVEKQEEAK